MLKKIQRHTETGNQQYRDYIQPANQDVFNIFDDRLSTIDNKWYTKEILDFGCNVGHLLTTSDGAIDPTNYVGVDILQNSLYIAKKLHPTASWIHYNAHNSTFNPTGVHGITLTLNRKFDYIIAYGVFTHCEIHEIIIILNNLKTMLKPNGSIVFSIWELPHFKGYLKFLNDCFKIPLIDDYEFFNVNSKKSLYLVNRNQLVIDCENTGMTDLKWLETFYNRKYFLETISGAVPMYGTYSHHSIFILKNE